MFYRTIFVVLSLVNVTHVEPNVFEKSNVNWNNPTIWKPPIFTPDCGKSTINTLYRLLIHDGNIAKPGEFPWHAGVYKSEGRINQKPICGATIISSRYLLSAAHCFADNVRDAAIVRPTSDYYILVGKLESRNKNSTEDNKQRYEIADLIVESYRGGAYKHQNDIIIIVTKSKIVFNSNVSPICLINENRPYIGNYSDLWVAGWGFDESGNQSEDLKSIELPFVSFNECSNFSNYNNLPSLLTTDKFCTGRKTGTSLDVGDSGGGVIIEGPNNSFYLIGVVSILLKAVPVVLCTFVPRYHEWISETIYHNSQNQLRVYFRLHIKLLEPYDDAMVDRTSSLFQEFNRNISSAIADEILGAPDDISSDTVALISTPNASHSEAIIDLKVVGDYNKTTIERAMMKHLKTTPSLGSFKASQEDFFIRDFHEVVPPLCEFANTIPCRNSDQCYPLGGRCDGISWCLDGSDEKDCPTKRNKISQRKLAEEKFQRAASIVEAKCTEYNDKIYKIIAVSSLPGRPPSYIKELDCKASKPLIVGGKKAEAKEFPHMALLGYINGNKTDWICGGSLISDRFVLSAAHCELNGREQPDLVLLGELDYSKDTDDARPTYYKIVERFKHPLYSPPKKVNDIILYKLNDMVKFDGYIRPICLSTSRLSVPGTNATITGWGRLDTIQKRSSTLMKATVDIFDPNNCVSAFRNHAYYPKGVDKNAIICAGNKGRREDVCKGDSGGPLQISAGTCLWKQLGIVSTGSNICGDTDNPEVIYTKVAHYIPWIQSIVWPETK